MNTDKKDFCLHEATITSVHNAMKSGELTCRKLVEMYLARINAYDRLGPALNSIIMINPKALEIADELDKRFKTSGLVGPLHGIPVLLKDNVDTGDMPTTAGSLSLEGVIPADDAFITKKLKQAGAIIIAKVNLHEFAVWGETASSILGQTLNPYDLTRTPGGSSGGTGAGISSNFGIIGIGTDTINSVRSPASACSLVGFRPTVGLVSRDGIVPYSMTQDTAGPIMRTVEDTAKVLDVIAGYDSDDPATAWSIGKVPETYTRFLNKEGLKGKRIGVLKSFFGDKEIHQEVNKVINNSLEEMKKNGATIVSIEENIDADKLVKEISVHLYDLKAHLNIYLEDLGSRAKVNSLADVIASGKYHEGIEENIKFAETLDINSPEYNERLIKRMELRNLVMRIMAEYKLDAIVYPHQKRPVVRVGEAQVERNGVIGSVTGFPACVVPAGFTKPTDTAPIGVPVGMEILGREWDEPTLIEIAYGFEQATGYRKVPVSVPCLE
ncbi:amidase family protein [Brassicibacter mesophilus]|uniref:amidase family protein n=1 Tax=Brassicibacter mesophilus TaxID=745119 RepID=UPI003D25C045